jgi:hypothetical protein
LILCTMSIEGTESTTLSWVQVVPSVGENIVMEESLSPVYQATVYRVVAVTHYLEKDWTPGRDGSNTPPHGVEVAVREVRQERHILDGPDDDSDIAALGGG